MSRVYYIFIDYVVLWASVLRIWMRVGLGASKLKEFPIIRLEREHAECCFQFSRQATLRQRNTAQHKTDTDQFRTTNDPIARNAFAISSFCHTIIIFEIFTISTIQDAIRGNAVKGFDNANRENHVHRISISMFDSEQKPNNV